MNGPDAVAYVSVGRLGQLLALVVGGVLLLHAGVLFSVHVLGHDHLMGLVPLLNMDSEQSIPTFVATTLFLLAAGGFFALGACSSVLGRANRHWYLLAVVFVFLALDEAASLHEHLTGPVREWLGLGGLFYFAWIVPYLILVALLAIYVVPRLLELPVGIRNGFLFSAILYLLGSVVLVAAGGPFGEVYEALPVAEQASYPGMLLYDLIASAEEAFELFGAALLVYTEALLLAEWRAGVRVRFSP